MNPGFLLAAVSALALGSVTSLVALSYDYGITVPDVLVVRGIFAATAVAIYCRLSRQRVIPGRRSIGHVIGAGAGLTGLGVGYMSSVVFITPGLAVTLMFTYPVMLLVMESIRTRIVPDILTVTAFAFALAGTAIAFGIGSGGGDAPDMRGVGFALVAAVGVALVFSVTAHAARGGHTFGFLMPAHLTVVLVAIVMVALAPVSAGGLTFSLATAPAEGLGLLLAACLLSGVGILLVFIAIGFADTHRVALVMYIEPIVTLIAARLFVDEMLTPLQYGGICMAVAGILLGGWLARTGR